MRSSRLPRLFLLWPTLLAAAITITGAQAQLQEARLVKDANILQEQYSGETGWVRALGKNAVFQRTTEAHGAELWITNGTLKGTRLLKDILPGPTSSRPKFPVTFGEGTGARVAFIVETDDSSDIWTTDGTEAGTLQIHQSPPDTSLEINATNAAGFFFTDQRTSTSRDLYFSDGTTAGTRLITPAGAGNPERFSLPWVHLTDGPWGYISTKEGEIWRTDGTDANTTKLVTIPLTPHGEATVRAVAGGRLFIDMYDLYDSLGEVWSCTLDGDELTRLNPTTGEDWWSVWPYHAVGDQVFFSVWDYSYTYHLWVTDGTAEGTREIELPYEEGEVARYSEVALWHGSIYYLAEFWDDDRHHFILFRTDGTEAGTKRLGTFDDAGLLPHAAWREKEDFFYFRTWNDDYTWDLWRTKGTAATTTKAKGLAANHYLRVDNEDLVTRSDAGMYYAANGTGKKSFSESLWRQRGKLGGATMLTRPEPHTESGAISYSEDTFPYGTQIQPLPYEMFGGHLLSFVKPGYDLDYELWSMKPDGSRAKAIWQPSAPVELACNAAFRGTTPHGAIFSYFDRPGTREVWVTDGTKKGTRRLSDHSGPDGSLPYDFVQLGDVMFYSVPDAELSLWKTDGTPAGTTPVVGADGATPAVAAYNMVAFQGSVWFPVQDASGKYSIWRSDGTPAGTVMVKDSFYAIPGERPVGFSVVDGKLTFSVQYFSARFSYEQALWQSDGTAAGTLPVSTSLTFQQWGVDRAVDVSGRAVFPAKLNVETRAYSQWWAADSTGINPIRSFVPSSQLPSSTQSDPTHAVAGSQFFYTNLSNLWASDGTAADTRDLGQLTSNAFSSPGHLLAVGDFIYFSARDPNHGNELWRSDGTATGTVLVADIQPGNGSSAPQDLKVMNGKLYFTAQRSDVGRELFVIDLPQ